MVRRCTLRGGQPCLVRSMQAPPLSGRSGDHHGLEWSFPSVRRMQVADSWPKHSRQQRRRTCTNRESVRTSGTRRWQVRVSRLFSSVVMVIQLKGACESAQALRGVTREAPLRSGAPGCSAVVPISVSPCRRLGTRSYRRASSWRSVRTGELARCCEVPCWVGGATADRAVVSVVRSAVANRSARRSMVSQRQPLCHSVASRPSTTSSANSPSIHAERRNRPSWTNPDLAAARCMATLSASVSICNRWRPRFTKP